MKMFIYFCRLGFRDIKLNKTFLDQYLHRFVIHFFKQSRLITPCLPVKESCDTSCRTTIFRNKTFDFIQYCVKFFLVCIKQFYQ